MKKPFRLPVTALVSTLSFVITPPAVQARTQSDIKRSNERKLLGPHYEGRLVPIETDSYDMQTAAEPLIFVHGHACSAQNFVNLVPAVPKLTNYQMFYFAYDDVNRSLRRTALELALAMKRIRAPRITVIAHSTGALVTREALNILSLDQPQEYLPEIHVIAVDTPWHGGDADALEAKTKTLDSLVEYFLPAAVADMRSCSEFFQNLYTPRLADKFSITLFFAEQGHHAWDYTEEPLENIPQKIADYINKGRIVSGNLAEMYFWEALRTSSQYSYFEVSLRSFLKVAPVTSEQVLEELKIYFPRLPGDHVTVLSPQPGKKKDLAQYLEEIL